MLRTPRTRVEAFIWGRCRELATATEGIKPEVWHAFLTESRGYVGYAPGFSREAEQEAYAKDRYSGPGQEPGGYIQNRQCWWAITNAWEYSPQWASMKGFHDQLSAALFFLAEFVHKNHPALLAIQYGNGTYYNQSARAMAKPFRSANGKAANGVKAYRRGVLAAWEAVQTVTTPLQSSDTLRVLAAGILTGADTPIGILRDAWVDAGNPEIPAESIYAFLPELI